MSELGQLFSPNRFCTFQTDLTKRLNYSKQLFIQKCIIKDTKNCKTDCLQLRKKGTQKHEKNSRKCVHISTNRETSVMTYISLY